MGTLDLTSNFKWSSLNIPLSPHLIREIFLPINFLYKQKRDRHGEVDI